MSASDAQFVNTEGVELIAETIAARTPGGESGCAASHEGIAHFFMASNCQQLRSDKHRSIEAKRSNAEYDLHNLLRALQSKDVESGSIETNKAHQI